MSIASARGSGSVDCLSLNTGSDGVERTLTEIWLVVIRQKEPLESRFFGEVQEEPNLDRGAAEVVHELSLGYFDRSRAALVL